MAKHPVYKTLLDCWTPPPVTGGEEAKDLIPFPIAFLSTTFTFDADFFEEECLSRFLCMETEKENDGAAYLIEREEKLAGLNGGIVLVDQLHCKGNRSLRWDLVPCRVKNGIMHAKITILHWSNCIRLIISSANLTVNGYCINQEIFSSIDFYPDSGADLKIITDILKYLQSLTSEHCGDTVKKRYDKIEAEILAALKKWGVKPATYRKDDVSVHTLLVSSKQRNGLARLREIWDNHFSSPPDMAYITSPFFDSAESEITPSKAILDFLQQRGPVETIYFVTADEISSEDRELIVNAPEFLRKSYRKSHTIIFEQVVEEGENENEKKVPRPLHLKSIWLSKDHEMHLFLIGSGNFTSAALGLGNRCNYEANLVFCVYKSRNKKGYDALLACNPDSFEMDESNLVFRQRENEDESTVDSEYVELPGFFSEAILCLEEERLLLELKFSPASGPVPPDFRIWSEDWKNEKGSLECICDETAWNNSKSQSIIIEWKAPAIPGFLLVSWNGSNGRAYWPVIAASQIALPPVDSLKNLPLDALLYILSTGQPLHRLMAAVERIKGKMKQVNTEETVVDPHQLVDTTRFLLQRTRRISYAMRALCKRLEKPVFTQESLAWKLHGPIGVRSLQQAIVNEAKSDEEKRFLLAELALELSRVSPQETEISLKQESIKAEIKKILEEMKSLLVSETQEINAQLEKYSLNAFNKAIDELSL